MKPPQLDKRLAAAAAFVRPGVRMADIGCDHGKLAVHMAMTGKAHSVIAVDAREEPLKKARMLAQHARAQDKVDCRLGDGLTVLKPWEADDVVMAGISGVTAAEILKAAPDFWQEDKRFVFVPASKADYLRRWLCRHGFEIIKECAAQAAGRYYAVLCTRYTGKTYEADAFFCALGLLAEQNNPPAAGYRRKVLAELEKKRAGRANDPRFTTQEKYELDVLVRRIKNTVAESG